MSLFCSWINNQTISCIINNGHFIDYFKLLVDTNILSGRTGKMFLLIKNPDSNQKFFEPDIIKMPVFMIDKIFAMFGGSVVQ